MAQQPAHFAVRSISRSDIARRLGYSFDDNRDLYESLGWKRDLFFGDYVNAYSRNPVARRIIHAEPDACWGEEPQLIEAGKDNRGVRTEFETAFDEIAERTRLFSYLNRVDVLSGLGSYAVVFLGFDDAATSLGLTQPVSRAGDLKYVSVYSEAQASIHAFEDDPTNPRYGKPKIYRIEPGDSYSGTVEGRKGGKKSSFNVHHSRVLHVADNRLTSDFFGWPRLQAVFNILQGIELIYGVAPEAYWRQGFPGLMFSIDKDLALQAEGDDSLDPEDFKDSLDKYIHGLQRFLMGVGIEAKSLNADLVSPADYVDVLIKIISIATGIPKRILEGSERGELSSSQDERQWAARNRNRRRQYIAPFILRPLIDQFVDVGILPAPGPDGYVIDWPDPFAPGEKEQAEIAKTKAQAIGEYVQKGGEEAYSRRLFLRDLGLTEDQIEEEIQNQEQAILDEEREMAEDQGGNERGGRRWG